MKTIRHLHVVLLLAATTNWWSTPAHAALGGTAGVVIPYAGKLELDGALVTGTFDLKFDVMVNDSTATVCDSKTIPVLVTNGEFSVSIASVLESCVKGKDVHLNIAVRRTGSPTFVSLGKQRVTPVLSAVTSGVGDFHVAGALSAASVVVNSPDNTEATNIAEFKAQNQTQGVGIGFNTVRATGSNTDVNLNLSPKGAGTVVVRGPLTVSGKAVPVADETGLRIIRGSVDVNGGFVAGGGFSAVQTATGRIAFTFDTRFSGPPTVVATAGAGAGSNNVCVLIGVSATGFATNTVIGADVSFIAIGPR